MRCNEIVEWRNGKALNIIANSYSGIKVNGFAVISNIAFYSILRDPFSRLACLFKVSELN